MSIGYACLTVGVPDAKFKNCVLKNAGVKKLQELIAHNLKTLENIIDYNIKNDIKLFRISSDLIPFGSSPVNNLPWHEDLSVQLRNIGGKIKGSAMRVSMHPGQYTVLNSPDANVVNRAIAELEYHQRVLESLGMDEQHKIVLHIGGVYKDKKSSARRFISHYAQLDEAVKKRTVIENDDRSYNIADVLEISQVIKAPVIYDNLHDQINPAGKENYEIEWIDACAETWRKSDGRQKVHYSQLDPLKKAGAHSNTISINEFLQFYAALNGRSLDIMLEVKDKNLSAVKCINCISSSMNIAILESEWSKYKYSVLERSPEEYLAIRRLLRDKKEYPAIEFYNRLETAFKIPMDKVNAANAALHVWGYFKDDATAKEKEKFLKLLRKFQLNEISISSIKTYLHHLMVKYQRDYLINSYYFVF
ncbi:MAG: UV DNA damage repair endonuclease UvsE [Syntrophomonadaceae bacterium]|nr:UV DNA damage repair endonuclease UvsE [Syntrophomonadaceae bacterium]